MQNGNKQSVHLTKGNQRWAWMAGATAAAAATAPHALATTAQISLVGNTLDSVTGDHLSVSTSPGHPFGTVVADTASGSLARAGLKLNGAGSGSWIVDAIHGGIGDYAKVFNTHAGSSQNVNHTGGTNSPQKAFDFIAFTLSDSTLPNALDGSTAFLEVEAFNDSATDQTAALLAIFYTEGSTTAPSLTIDETTGAITGSYTNVGSSDAGVFSPVPEPSSLALLALGAGGILARRKRRKAA